MFGEKYGRTNGWLSFYMNNFYCKKRLTPFSDKMLSLYLVKLLIYSRRGKNEMLVDNIIEYGD